MLKAAGPLTLLALFYAARALAEGESSEAHTIVEAGTAQGTEMGSAWALHQSYGVSLMRLSQAGQGYGARLSLVPPTGASGTWEGSADAVFRAANDSPWYFKGLGGVAIAPQSGPWPPRLRAGVEVGLTAIRGGIGLEAGVSVIDSFPPSKPLEGQVVVSLGMGILFGFGAPPAAKGAICQEERPHAQPARGQRVQGPAPTGSLRHDPVAASASPQEGLTLVSAGRAQQQDEEPSGEFLESETLLYGLGDLHAYYRRYVSTLETSAAVAMGSPRAAGVNLGAQPALARMRAELEAECREAGFADGLAGFEKSIRDYQHGFERETVALAGGQLMLYERFLLSQERRYQKQAEAEALYQAVAGTQARAGYEEAEYIRNVSRAGLVLTLGEVAEQSHQVGRRRQALARAESEMASIVDAHPVVGEADFPRERLARASKQDVQSVVFEHLAARKQDVADTRKHLDATPEMVYGLDVLLAESFRAQSIESGTLTEKLIREHIRELEVAEALPRMTLAAVAVAAGLASGGGGTAAVLATGTTGAVGAYQATEELQRYRLQSAAYGAKLTSEEPGMGWVIVAVLGAGMDAAAFASALPKLRPALQAFNVGPEADNLLALERKLAKLTEVEAALKRNILRAASAEVEARAAWRALLVPRAPLRAVVTPGAAEFGRLVHAVYLTSTHGVRKFQLFVKTNEAVELLGEVAKLGTGELAALKRGYLAAVKQLGAVAAHGKALGMSDGDLTAFMELHGKAKGLSVADLMQEMDAWKAAGARRQGVGQAGASALPPGAPKQEPRLTLLQGRLAALELSEEEYAALKLAELEKEATTRVAGTREQLKALRPSKARPPPGVAEEDALWRKYVDYYDGRLDELDAYDAGRLAKRPENPLDFAKYKLFKSTVARGIEFENKVMELLVRESKLPLEQRTLTKAIQKARIDQRVGILKEGHGTVLYVDQLVVDLDSLAGDKPLVECFSNKSRDFARMSVEEAKDIAVRNFEELWAKYNGPIEVRRPGHPLFGQKVDVSNLHLVYDLKGAPPEKITAIVVALARKPVKVHFR